VLECAVVAHRDADTLVKPKAFVVLQENASLDADAVMAFVAERVSPHKKVRKVEFISTVPKSTAGKILRKDLRAAEAGH
jgi:4-coumarate--CoA ligase